MQGHINSLAMWSTIKEKALNMVCTYELPVRAQETLKHIYWHISPSLDKYKSQTVLSNSVKPSINHTFICCK